MLLYIVTFFQRIPYGKRGKRSNFTMEKFDKHDLTQIIKVNINIVKDVDRIYTWSDVV